VGTSPQLAVVKTKLPSDEEKTGCSITSTRRLPSAAPPGVTAEGS
jgi:hypothetical protein